MNKERVADGTIWGSEEWYRARWDSVPEEMKEKIIARLREIPNLDEVKAAVEESRSEFHFFGGMQVRNMLRDVVLDNELPFAPYPDGEYQNWDDYYVQAIRAA